MRIDIGRLSRIGHTDGIRRSLRLLEAVGHDQRHILSVVANNIVIEITTL